LQLQKSPSRVFGQNSGNSADLAAAQQLDDVRYTTRHAHELGGFLRAGQQQVRRAVLRDSDPDAGAIDLGGIGKLAAGRRQVDVVDQNEIRTEV
jgi:hypothetical protein